MKKKSKKSGTITVDQKEVAKILKSLTKSVDDLRKILTQLVNRL